MTSLGFNSAAAATTNLLGLRVDPYLSFNFLVEIEGLLVGGFSEVSGLQMELEVEAYREGGQNEFIHQLAGPNKYPNNLTLKRGLTDIETLSNWYEDVARGKIKRQNGTIYVLDRQRVPAMWWDFTGAYPVKWSGPQLQADTNQAAIETVELAHQGITKPTLSKVASAARLAGELGGQLLP